MERKLLIFVWGCLIIFAVALGIEAATTGVTVTDNGTMAVQEVDSSYTKYANEVIDNKKWVVTSSYNTEIAQGNVSGVTPIKVTGHTVGTKLNTLVDLSHLTTDAIPLAAAAGTLEVTSSNAQDFATGTGIRSIFISGTDATGAEQSETLTLAASSGTGVVTTANQYLRVNFVNAVTAGTGAKAAGTVYIRALADTPVYSAIPTGFNSAMQSMYTVPLGKTATLTGWSGGGVDEETVLYLQATVNPANGYALTSGIFQTLDIMHVLNTQDSVEFSIPIELPAGADIKITSESLTAADGKASGTFNLFYQ